MMGEEERGTIKDVLSAPALEDVPRQKGPRLTPPGVDSIAHVYIIRKFLSLRT